MPQSEVKNRVSWIVCDLFGKIIFKFVKKTLEHVQSNILADASTNSILYSMDGSQPGSILALKNI